MKTLTIRINGDTIHVAADHPFWVEGKGWINASDLRVGDRIRWRGIDAAVEAIIADGEAEIVPNFSWSSSRPSVGLMGRMSGFTGDTLIDTPDGPKKMRDIKPGDQITMRDPFDPERN